MESGPDGGKGPVSLKSRRTSVRFLIPLTIFLVLVVLWALFETDSEKEIYLVVDYLPEFVLFSPNGQFVVSQSPSGKIDLWDLRMVNDKITLQGDHTGAQAAFNIQSTELVFVNERRSITIWNTVHSKVERVIENIKGVCAITCNKDHHLGIVTEDSILLWDRRSKQVQARIQEDAWRNALHFTPDGDSLVFMCADGNLKLWDLQQNQIEIIGLDQSILTTPLHMSSTGEFLAYGTQNGTITVWNLPQKRFFSIPLNTHGFPTSLSFCSQGDLIASPDGDNLLSFWEVRTRKLVARYTDYSLSLRNVCLSPDGKTFAYSSLNRIRIVSRSQIHWYSH